MSLVDGRRRAPVEDRKAQLRDRLVVLKREVLEIEEALAALEGKPKGRDSTIYHEWLNGAEMRDLAVKYGLRSASSISRILDKYEGIKRGGWGR